MLIEDYFILICYLLILYPFIIYPLILELLVRIYKNQLFQSSISDISTDQLPAISVLIAAYNEVDTLEETIETIYKQQYPKMQVHVGSDGSNDGTVELLYELQKKYPSLCVYDITRRGKNRINEFLIAHSQSEIIVHIDADCRIVPNALHAMCARFIDPEIGAVLGNSIEFNGHVYEHETLEKEQSAYRSLEYFTRLRESQLASTVTSLGHFYALRRRYRKPLPNDSVCDDYTPLLSILADKKRVVVETKASVYEVRKSIEGMEYLQAQRFAACGIASLLFYKRLLLPTYGLISFFLWSRKMLRWCLPFFSIILLILTSISVVKMSMIGLFSASIWTLLFIGALAWNLGFSFKPFHSAYIFIRLHISLIMAWLHTIHKKQSAVWERPTA